jgi:hypothetical protein
MSKKSRSSAKKSRVKRIRKDKSRKKRTEPSDDSKRQLIQGEERKVHEEIIDRRIGGGVALSKEEITEAYDRALTQWQQLPGSIVRPPTDVTLSTQNRRKSQQTSSESDQTHGDAANGGQ